MLYGSTFVLFAYTNYSNFESIKILFFFKGYSANTLTFVLDTYKYVAQLSLYKRFLAHLSQRLICELIVYPCSGVRPSSSVCRPISNIFSKTACPIKAKFHVGSAWVGGTKDCSRHPYHMTKMAATPICI